MAVPKNACTCAASPTTSTTLRFEYVPTTRKPAACNRPITVAYDAAEGPNADVNCAGVRKWPNMGDAGSCTCRTNESTAAGLGYAKCTTRRIGIAGETPPRSVATRTKRGTLAATPSDVDAAADVQLDKASMAAQAAEIPNRCICPDLPKRRPAGPPAQSSSRCSERHYSPRTSGQPGVLYGRATESSWRQ